MQAEQEIRVISLVWAVSTIPLPKVPIGGLFLEPISAEPLGKNWRENLRASGILGQFLSQTPGRGRICKIRIRLNGEEITLWAAQSNIPTELRLALDIPDPPPLPF